MEIARQQAATAQQQAQTALDQLRYNLFEKRYAIYEKLRKELPTTIARRSAEHRLNMHDVEPFHIALQEAQFFFSEPLCRWLSYLWDDVVSVVKRESTQARILSRLEGSARIFGPELRFSQLTTLHAPQSGQ